MDLPDGYAARAATRDDVTALWRLVCATDMEEYGVPDIDESDVVDALSRDRFDPKTDTWVVERGGEVVAYADAWDKSPHTLLNAECTVHPDAPDLYPWLVARITARAAEHAAVSGRAVVHAFGAEPNARRNAALTGAGYAVARVFHRMHRSLDGLPPVPAGDVTVARADDVRLAYDLHQASFAGHYDFVPMTYDAWRAAFVETASYRPEHWWVASVRGEPVGILIGQVHDGERGWVKSVGTVPEAREQGVATALLLTAFHAFRDAGLPAVALGVDSDNATGAVALYERLGMTADRRFNLWERVIER